MYLQVGSMEMCEIVPPWWPAKMLKGMVEEDSLLDGLAKPGSVSDRIVKLDSTVVFHKRMLSLEALAECESAVSIP